MQFDPIYCNRQEVLLDPITILCGKIYSTLIRLKATSSTLTCLAKIQQQCRNESRETFFPHPGSQLIEHVKDLDVDVRSVEFLRQNRSPLLDCPVLQLRTWAPLFANS